MRSVHFPLASFCLQRNALQHLMAAEALGDLGELDHRLAPLPKRRSSQPTKAISGRLIER